MKPVIFNKSSYKPKRKFAPVIMIIIASLVLLGGVKFMISNEVRSQLAELEIVE